MIITVIVLKRKLWKKDKRYKRGRMGAVNSSNEKYLEKKKARKIVYQVKCEAKRIRSGDVIGKDNCKWCVQDLHEDGQI